MFKSLIQTFFKPSAQEIAKREYEEAQRQLLEDQTLAEHYASRVQFQRTRINRLSHMLQNGSK